MKKIIAIVALLGIINISSAQSLSSDMPISTSTLGLGIGLPYGTIGVRVGVDLTQNLNIFGGVGYHFVGMGANAGLKLSAIGESRTRFYFQAMYGSNGAILVEGASRFNETYYGVSAGIGINVMSRKSPGSYFDLGLIVPILSEDFKDDIDIIKNHPLIEGFNEPSPILLTLGYNFSL